MSLVLALVTFSCHLAMAEVYLTAKEAMEKTFADMDRYVTYVTEGRISDRQPMKISRIFRDDKVIGWAVELNEMGKNTPITFLVAISPEFAVLDVYLLEYRDLLGSEIKRRSFLRQFRRKTSRSPLSVGRDIDAVTGATISSHSATYAVKRALEAVEKLQTK